VTAGAATATFFTDESSDATAEALPALVWMVCTSATCEVLMVASTRVLCKRLEETAEPPISRRATVKVTLTFSSGTPTALATDVFTSASVTLAANW